LIEARKETMQMEMALIQEKRNMMRQEEGKKVNLENFNNINFFQANLIAEKLASRNEDPAQMLTKLIIASGLGLGLMSIHKISFIRDKPVIEAHVLLAAVQASGQIESIKEEYDSKKATVTIKRKGGEEKTTTFTLDEAKTAQLLNNANYQKWPQRMLLARARSFALRDQFADLLQGVMPKEELQDEIDRPSMKNVSPKSAPDFLKEEEDQPSPEIKQEVKND